MRKGQISFDLILATIVAIIFVGSIANVVSVIADNARIDSIKSQEKQIANELAEVLMSSSIFIGNYDPINPNSADSTFKIAYNIPKIRTPYPGNPNDCDIQITPENITITYHDVEGDVIINRPFTMSQSSLSFINTHIEYIPGPFPKCGEGLVITNE